MLIREVSDLHLEFEDFDLPPLPEDKDTVLVLAGDIGLVFKEQLKAQLFSFLQAQSRAFKAVIYVLGNHEHYRYSISDTLSTIRDVGLPSNVHVLENQTVVIDNVSFIGSTLWTNYDNDPVKEFTAERMLNDHRLITIWDSEQSCERTFRASDARQFHDQSKRYIFNEVVTQKNQGRKVVVVVHHGVSYQSVHPMYATSEGNSAFTSALDNDVLATQPDLIFHGHTHQCFDYFIGSTRVIVNPKGYPNERNSFNPLLRVDL